MDLFRSFYVLRFTANKERSGCMSFRITDGMKGTYIPIARNGENIVTNVTKRVEDFPQALVPHEVRQPERLL